MSEALVATLVRAAPGIVFAPFIYSPPNNIEKTKQPTNAPSTTQSINQVAKLIRKEVNASTQDTPPLSEYEACLQHRLRAGDKDGGIGGIGGGDNDQGASDC